MHVFVVGPVGDELLADVAEAGAGPVRGRLLLLRAVPAAVAGLLAAVALGASPRMLRLLAHVVSGLLNIVVVIVVVVVVSGENGRGVGQQLTGTPVGQYGVLTGRSHPDEMRNEREQVSLVIRART